MSFYKAWFVKLIANPCNIDRIGKIQRVKCLTLIGYKTKTVAIMFFIIMGKITVQKLRCCKYSCAFINTYLMNGFSHHYHLGESTFIFRGVRSDFYFFISFFEEISLCKQNSPRWDAAFCDVTSGAMMFVYVP